MIIHTMKNIFKSFTLIVMGILTMSCQSTNREVTSPNGKIKVTLECAFNEAYSPVSFQVDYQGKRVLTHADLGIETDQQKFHGNLKLKSVSQTRPIKEEYTMISGKRSRCANDGCEKTYTFENEQGQLLGVTFRAYNDGVAFSYQLESSAEKERVIQEYTTYRLPEGCNRWMQVYDPGYERFYPLSTTGESTGPRAPKQSWGYPALVEWEANHFMLLTEANVQRGHCGSLLENKENSHHYRIALADQKQEVKGKWQSPWRLLMIGSLAEVVESTLVTDVSDPCKLKDTSWIKPGLVSWIYWAHNHGSRDYKLLKEYIDLGTHMHWPYTLIDAEWDEMGNGGNMEDVLKYAAERGIKPLVWYNSSTNWINGPGPRFRLNKKADREKEYQWLKDHGAAGIKVDFFSGDLTATMDYYLDLLEDAIPYQLMVNFHGSSIPKGWQRTYPHMVSMEGVYGAEWYNNSPVLTNRAAKHNATLPFTRNVIGPMDYTPGTFSDSQHPHITTHGHELALPVIFESTLQHMPDRPSVYYNLPAPVKALLSTLPTAWDDTKLLAGYPGTDVVLARRKGNCWYIGGINGTDETRTLQFSLGNIAAEGQIITLFKDGADGRSFTIEENIPLSHEVINQSIQCLPRGGFVAIIKQQS